MDDKSLTTSCRICDSSDLEQILDLGQQPWCNNFLSADEIGSEPRYPLSLLFCHGCATVQLSYTVPKETMFSDHTYLSGVTTSLSEHFRSVAQQVDELFFCNTPDKAALDIGSNDGTQLKHFRDLGYDVLGVESSKAPAQLARDAGIATLSTFFNQDVAREIGRQFHVINAAGVFFHLEELHSVTDGIREALREDGVFVVQFLYMKSIVENLAFDQIYHEHLLYYNLATIEALLRRHGLMMFDAHVSPIHGGSVVGYVTHADRVEVTPRLRDLKKAEDEAGSNKIATYQAFAEEVRQVKVRDLAYLDDAKTSGKRVFGMGAPAKGNTLLNYLGAGTQYIECLVERNELRRGLYSPGMHIPILLESELADHPDIYYVLAWNFKEEILKRQGHLTERGVEFYFPVTPREP